MKLNIEKIHSPCEDCYIKGIVYSEDSDRCQRCAYNIAIKVLQVLLKYHENCWCCGDRDVFKGGYCGCKIDKEDNCDTFRDYLIDWKAVCREYDIELVGGNSDE